MAQIQKRGRDYEQSMRLEYLGGLNNRYEEWVEKYPGKMLIVDGDKLTVFGDYPTICRVFDAKERFEESDS